MGREFLGVIAALALVVIFVAALIQAGIRRSKKQAPKREVNVPQTMQVVPRTPEQSAETQPRDTSKAEALRRRAILPEFSGLEVGTRAAARPPISEKYWMLPEVFVVFDLETTGLNPNRNKIIEIGAIKVARADLYADRQMLETYQSFIRISGRIPPKIVELTGIVDAVLKEEGTPLQEALNGFLDFAQDLPLVAFNAKFDVAFLGKALGDSRMLLNEVICCLTMARDSYPGLPSYKLANITSSVDAGASHRALADCHRALIVYLRASVKLGRGR